MDMDVGMGMGMGDLVLDVNLNVDHQAPWRDSRDNLKGTGATSIEFH